MYQASCRPRRTMVASSFPMQPERTIDERFNEVSVAIAEMHDYTAFCFEKLRTEFRQGLEQAEGRLTLRLDTVDGRLDRHELILSEILTEVRALRKERTN